MSLKQPVQYPVKYYSHLDSGAPQLVDEDGVIKSILKACLVTGYGDKEGAGWTSLFEDTYRLVLRRPLGTGNPPDIKIENGVINGAASHRIVSQDRPTGLDDTSEIESVKMLTRDIIHGPEWHLIVSDFAFILCYQMGRSFSHLKRNYLMYCGSVIKLQDSSSDIFVASEYTGLTSGGKSDSDMQGFLGRQTIVKDMRSGLLMSNKQYLTVDKDEKYINNDYCAQGIMLDSVAMTPFFCSLAFNTDDMVTKEVTINNRSMLRYVNVIASALEHSRPVYIPLDYWEL